MNDRTKLRDALLTAAEADLKKALEHTAEAAPDSPNYLRWEAELLRTPITPSPWKRHLRTAACFFLILSLSFGAGIFSGPQVKAAMSKWLDPAPQPTATGMEVTVQLSGKSGCVFTSEKFACVDENGDTLWYWYHNTGDGLCSLQLYKVGTFGDKKLGEAILIEPGDDAFGTYKDPGNGVYYLRVTCIDVSGGHIDGSLRADQYNLS